MSVGRIGVDRLFRVGTLVVEWRRRPSRRCRGLRRLPVLSRAPSSPGLVSTVANKTLGETVVFGEAFGGEGPTLDTAVRIGVGAQIWPVAGGAAPSTSWNCLLIRSNVRRRAVVEEEAWKLRALEGHHRRRGVAEFTNRKDGPLGTVKF